MSNKQQQRVDSATCDVVCGAHHGNVDTVRKWLLGDGRDNVNKQAVVLYRPAARGHTDICQLVIDCDTVSTDGLTFALNLACSKGHLSVVQLIVSTLGHHCNSQLLDDCLHVAALHSHTKVVKWLLRLTHPTDVDYIMRWDLVQASARGDLTRVTQLVNTIGRHVNDVMSHALWAACYWGRVDIVDWMMTHTSVDVNYSRMIRPTIGSMTSLSAGCYIGHLIVAKRLLMDATSPCDVNMVTGGSRNTALHDVIKNTRWTLLHKSCYRGDTTAAVGVVYECDVNIQNSKGRTAMHYACANGHLDTVKVLLSVFADTNIADENNRTPVALCEYTGSPELAHYIQHNHLMYVSGDDDNDSNITASGRVGHNTTHTQVSIEDSVFAQPTINNNENHTN
jgi:ankyrin repeat protein